MSVRIQIPRKSFVARVLALRWARWALIAAASVFVVAAGITIYYYNHYARAIEDKLSIGPFAKTARVFGAPETIRVGDESSPQEIAAGLRKAGYVEAKNGNLVGWYNFRGQAIEIFPGPDSYFRQDPFLIRFSGGKVSQIISLRDSTRRNQYQLEPELITNLFDRNRSKRRIVHYDDIPQVLVQAVVSAEDKRFFRHAGFDPLRIARTAWVDITQNRRYGASTITMQLARGLWLTPEKTPSRKAAEALVTLHLERTLTKEQIFEYYANHVDLGRRGSFEILGFGEASQAFLGKDISRLTVAEAALLAGQIQRPSYTNPVRWPERAKARRNIVLSLMRENGYISDRDYALAVQEPVRVVGGSGESTDAPYFVDLVNDWLTEQLQQHDFQNSSHRVYTTLDVRLQRAAADAVRIGIKESDDLLDKRRKKSKRPVPEPQVALVALDAETGEVRALIGGRNYGLSQLDRALSKRQPGSIFKPFVYAAAFNTALEPENGPVITPETSIMDEPTTFIFDQKEYEPGNFGDKFYGEVTLRTALAKSLNVPTVKVAEMIGYDKVADLAKKAGLERQVGTPSVALGSYDATPLDMAGAYTIFANGGSYIRPTWVKAIYGQEGSPIYEAKIEKKNVLDPRVAYVMVNMMEEVVRSGTAAGIRSRGFRLPVAGKTGTSHDGWFAGFTSKLICVVWVGFDDNSDLKLEGSKSALPIWTEFMKRAHEIREYRHPAPFSAPEGVIVMDACAGGREAFIAGSEPAAICGGGTRVASWDESDPSHPTTLSGGKGPSERAALEPGAPEPNSPQGKKEQKKEKRGFFGRIRDIFK